MKRLTAAETLVRTVIRITGRENNGEFQGTGFFMFIPIKDNMGIPVIISNKHILCNDQAEEFTFNFSTLYEDKIKRESFPITRKVRDLAIFKHPKSNVDLAAVVITDVINNRKDVVFEPIPFEWIPKDWEYLDAIEELVMIGYPFFKGQDSNHNPISRRGITATSLQNQFNGQDKFLADIPVYQGSSGSPLFIFNQTGGQRRSPDGSLTMSLGAPRVEFVGIQSQGFLTDNMVRVERQHHESVNYLVMQPELPRVSVSSFMNLAIVEKSSQLFELAEVVKTAAQP